MDVGLSQRQRVRRFFVWPSVWLLCTTLCVLLMPSFLRNGAAINAAAVLLGYGLALYCLRWLARLESLRRLRTQPGWYLLVTSGLLCLLFMPCCFSTDFLASLVLGALG